MEFSEASRFRELVEGLPRLEALEYSHICESLEVGEAGIAWMTEMEGGEWKVCSGFMDDMYSVVARRSRC